MAWMHCQIYSEQLRMPTSVEVLLPQSVLEKQNRDAKLPVLYLLHDRTGDHSQWLRKAALETYQEEVPAAIIMPSGNASYYVNLKYGKNYQNYIREELPKLCEGMLPVSDRREEKYLAGVGMGGYGALNIGLGENCPFGVIGSFQADIDIKKYYQKNAEKLEQIFGSLTEYEQSPNCLFHAAENMPSSRPLPEIIMMCNQEHEVLKEHRDLYSVIKSKSDRVELRTSTMPDGWSYYGECLFQFMKDRI